MLSGPPVLTGISPNRALYRAHTANLHALSQAITQIELQYKAAAKKSKPTGCAVNSALLQMLNGIWAETQLRKLVYENGVLNDSARRAILFQPQVAGRARRPIAKGQRDRWTAALEQVFCRRYSVASWRSLPNPARQWHETLRPLLEVELVPLIDDRNHWAHGGWVVPLRDEAISSKAVELDDYLVLREKRKMVLIITDVLREFAKARPGTASEARLQASFEKALRDLDLRRALIRARTASLAVSTAS